MVFEPRWWWTPLTPKRAREHNHANVLCFSADRTPVDVMCESVGAWMNAEPQPDRHARRVEQMAEIERGASPQDQASSSA